MSDMQLFFRDVLIGRVTLRSTEGANGDGLLVPTAEYQAARPSLQMLTSKIALLPRGSKPAVVQRTMLYAMKLLARDGLELRSEAGARVPTVFLMVADYYPLDCNPGLLGTMLPILVSFERAMPRAGLRLLC